MSEHLGEGDKIQEGLSGQAGDRKMNRLWSCGKTVKSREEKGGRYQSMRGLRCHGKEFGFYPESPRKVLIMEMK